MEFDVDWEQLGEVVSPKFGFGVQFFIGLELAYLNMLLQEQGCFYEFLHIELLLFHFLLKEFMDSCFLY